MAAPGSESPWMNEELRMFRATVRQFIQKEFAPQQARWREQQRPDAEAWTQAGRTGLLLPDLLLRNASGRPLHLAMYGLVALTMAIVGRLAGHGRRWRPLRAVAALAAGYVLLYVLLRAGFAAAVVLTRDLGAAVPFP